MSEITSPSLHIAIAAAPSNGISLDREVKLVKAALLYADTVSLLSPSFTLLGSVAALGDLRGLERVQFVEAFAQKTHSTADNEAALRSLEIYRKIKSKDKRKRSEEEWKLLSDIEQYFELMWSERLIPNIEKLLSESGGHGLFSAIESGVLSIEPLAMEKDWSSDQIISQFTDGIQEMLKDPGVYPLFDDETGSLVRSAYAEGIWTPPSFPHERGKQVVIAADALGRLPAFPEATVDEVLDIRKELREPLVRFRAAMIRLGRLVEGAFFNQDAHAQFDELYREHIAPAILEIEEKVHDTTYLRELLAQVAGSSSPLITAILAFGVTRVADLPWMLSVATPMAHAATSAALQKFTTGQRDVSRYEMFFLYRTQQILARNQ